MNQRAGFAILLFAAFMLIVSSVSVKVTAQGGSSSENSTTAANGFRSPELFKAKPALCAVLHAIKHTSAKGSGPSAEKAAGSSPIEVKQLPTMEVKTSGMVTAEKLQIKKPAAAATTSTNPVSENCLQTKTRSGNSLCLTIGSNANVAYETGTKKGDEAFAKCESAGKCGTYSTTSYAKGKPNGHTKVEVFVNPAI
jgi:hypothetical protein